MSKPRLKSLVDIPSTSLPGIPLNLQCAPKTSTTSGPRSAAASTSSCRASDDDDVFGLKSLSSRGSSVSALSTPAAVATLVQIGGGGSTADYDDESSVFTDWDRLKTEAAAIAGGIALEKSETPNKVFSLDAFSPNVGDSPLLFSGEAREPPDNLLVSSPEGSPLKPVRLNDQMVAESGGEEDARKGEGENSAASVRGRGDDCVGDLISIGESGKENSEPPSKCCNCGGGAPRESDNLLTLLDLDLGESSLAPIMFGGDDRGQQNKKPAAAKTAKLLTPAKSRLSLLQRQSLSRATGSNPAAGRRPLGVANSQQKQWPPPPAATAAAAKGPVSLNNRRSLLPPAKKQTTAATPLPATPARRPLATPNRRSLLPSTPSRRSFLPATPSRLATPARTVAATAAAAGTTSTAKKMPRSQQHSGVSSRELFRPKAAGSTATRSAVAPMVATQRFTGSTTATAGGVKQSGATMTPMRPAPSTPATATTSGALNPRRRRSGLPSPIRRPHI